MSEMQPLKDPRSVAKQTPQYIHIVFRYPALIDPKRLPPIDKNSPLWKRSKQDADTLIENSFNLSQAFNIPVQDSAHHNTKYVGGSVKLDISEFVKPGHDTASVDDLAALLYYNYEKRSPAKLTIEYYGAWQDIAYNAYANFSPDVWSEFTIGPDNISILNKTLSLAAQNTYQRKPNVPTTLQYQFGITREDPCKATDILMNAAKQDFDKGLADVDARAALLSPPSVPNVKSALAINQPGSKLLS